MRQYFHSMVERHLLFSSGCHIHELQRDAMSGTQRTKDFDPEDWTGLRACEGFERSASFRTMK